MKTKFVLHGGFSREKAPTQEDDAFFQEMLKDAVQDVKVLLVYFAEREEKVQLRIGQDQEQLNKNKGSRVLHFKVAAEETFIHDCAWADIIYLHGGRTVKLMEALKKYQNMGQVFSGKIIAGDSAGANVLRHWFYSKNSKEIGEGLGILPLKIVVHYEDGIPNPLADVEPALETLFLREYQTVVQHY
ncbi:Type 1 glutamine amidotransferase-like domain-containing protein [Candidatus Uhrbacteria bacterium]|nr:Type 1 glutamine amidotransferase-like domain-containing protein [Candidatus Uhrbacteria bacterium]